MPDYYLEKADDNAYMAEAAYQLGNEGPAAIRCQIAIAHALIALVKRLDRLTTDTGNENQQRALRIIRMTEL